MEMNDLNMNKLSVINKSVNNLLVKENAIFLCYSQPEIFKSCF